MKSVRTNSLKIYTVSNICLKQEHASFPKTFSDQHRFIYLYVDLPVKLNMMMRFCDGLNFLYGVLSYHAYDF